jgi:hypothetical protein
VKVSHAIAIACFVAAFIFYALAWRPFAYGFAAFGIIFEGIAWFVIFGGGKSPPESK